MRFPLRRTLECAIVVVGCEEFDWRHADPEATRRDFESFGVLHKYHVNAEDADDDFFLVLRGRMTIQLRDRDVELSEGEMFVVPRGIEHCPKADEEAHVLLIEPRGTVNTGGTGGDRTAEEMEI